MARQLVLVDTSLLIDLFRKTDKENAALISLVRQGFDYCISAITDYEIYSGAGYGQVAYWNEFLQKTNVLPFDKNVAKLAVEINRKLKQQNKRIAIPDLFIASTAIYYNLSFATLNKKHFERIQSLKIIE